jgi:hypothetical protein
MAKTTVDLPDALIRAAKIRAVNEGRKLKDVLADLIRAGLEGGPRRAPDPRPQVRLPLVECRHAAAPEEEATPARVADILAEEEASRARPTPA